MHLREILQLYNYTITTTKNACEPRCSRGVQ